MATPRPARVRSGGAFLGRRRRTRSRLARAVGEGNTMRRWTVYLRQADGRRRLGVVTAPDEWLALARATEMFRINSEDRDRMILAPQEEMR